MARRSSALLHAIDDVERADIGGIVAGVAVRAVRHRPAAHPRSGELARYAHGEQARSYTETADACGAFQKCARPHSKPLARNLNCSRAVTIHPSAGRTVAS